MSRAPYSKFLLSVSRLEAGTFSPARIRYDEVRIYEPEDMYKSHAVTNEVELRGFDGNKTAWRTFVLDFTEGDPASFRWPYLLAALTTSW